uniref:MMS19 nucleotide excision repair protein n=1 Tax=Gouania willdenowi TaxID=441366 RepID=A0A8C5H1F7_GOUWI
RSAAAVNCLYFGIFSLCRPCLTNSQAHTRARGVQLLSEVLLECYEELTEREVEVLIAFYENRLKDHYVIIPAVLQGLKALVSDCTVLPPGSAVSMLRSLFQDVHVQVRPTRYYLVICLPFFFLTELKGLGADFVFGFVQSMDGERDPRNLLLAFQIAKNLIRRGYNQGKFTEELFEVTSCYFPIDFSPPPNDPHGITKEELIQTLRDVLTGTPKFAEYLLPLLIEKLDSDVQSSKLDSLQTLASCVSEYEHKDLAEFLEGLWTSLRREVFQTSSEKIESAALAALTALTSCLSRSVLNSDSEDSLSAFMDLVLKDCKHHLCEPDLKLVWPSAKLLQAACSASNRATTHVYSIFVFIHDNFNYLEFFPTMSYFFPLVVPEDVNMFSDFREALCTIAFSAISESNSNLQITAASVLTSLAQQKGLLSEADIQRAVDHLCRLLLIEDDDRVSLAVVECAGTLAELHPDAFITTLIPKLKDLLLFHSEPMDQDREASEQNTHHALRQRCLSALAAVSTQPCVVKESTPVILQVLSSAHKGNQRVYVQNKGCSLWIMRFCFCFVQTRVLFLLSQSSCGFLLCVFNADRLAAQTADRLVSLFLDGDVSFLPDNSLPANICLLKVCVCVRVQSQLVCLLMACVCSLPKTLEVPQCDRLLLELEGLSCTSLHPLSYTSAAKCFAGLVNKRAQGERVLVSTVELYELDCSSSSVRTQTFTLLIWVSKALLLRYHPLTSAFTDKIFSLLDDAELGPMAADSFSLLMSDSADVLSRGCHADVRIMYRQRFFSENSHKLVQGFNAAPQGRPDKPNYLKALSNIVSKLPQQVQVTELPALLSLLLEALTCPDGGVQLSTLSCLQPVLINPPQTLIQQLEALVSRLLVLISSAQMNVRVASLRCIHTLSYFPVHEVLPFRARVLRALAKPLDDKKRLVRSEAVIARGEWFLLGSPGGR